MSDGVTSGRSLRRPARVASVVLAAVAGAMTVAGCGSSASSASSTTAPSLAGPSKVVLPGPTESASPITYPLTGATASSAAAAARPVVTVAIAMTPSAAPVGLDSADIVWQEAGDAASSRLLAMYQSKDAATVGPVTSTDPVDPKILELTKGLVGYNGGSNGFIRQLDASGITDLGAVSHGSAYSTSPTLPAPWNLMTSTTGLRSSTTVTTPASPRVFAYASTPQQFATSNVGHATQVQVALPGGQATEVWNYDAAHKQWVRMTNGQPTAHVNNLVVQLAWYHTAYVNHYRGITISTADVTGRGVATVFSRGMYARGDWSRPGTSATTAYTDSTGVPVRLAPGSTWVLLAPVGSTITTH
jgi:hypothetical protein